MKFNAVFATLIPWIIGILGINLLMVVGKSYELALMNVGLVWLMMSPLFIAGVILVAYREGQWSKEKNERMQQIQKS